MASACDRVIDLHGRGNNIYRTCREHTECEECREEVRRNLSSLHQPTQSDHADLCLAYGISHNACTERTMVSRHEECTAYCDGFSIEDQETCLQTCLYDTDSFGTYIEAVERDRRREREWIAYKDQIKTSTRKLLVKMKHASSPVRFLVGQKIAQLAAD